VGSAGEAARIDELSERYERIQAEHFRRLQQRQR